MKRKQKKIKKIILLIYIVFLLSIILTNGLSRYRTTYGNMTSTEIAKPIINIITENELEIKDLYNEETEWNFSINNYSNDEINQVALMYRIKIEKEELIDLQYKLYKILEDGTQEEILINQNASVEEFELSNNHIQEDKYKLIIKTTDNIDQKGLNENIKISVIATQIT